MQVLFIISLHPTGANLVCYLSMAATHEHEQTGWDFVLLKEWKEQKSQMLLELLKQRFATDKREFVPEVWKELLPDLQHKVQGILLSNSSLLLVFFTHARLYLYFQYYLIIEFNIDTCFI